MTHSRRFSRGRSVALSAALVLLGVAAAVVASRMSPPAPGGEADAPERQSAHSQAGPGEALRGDNLAASRLAGQWIPDRHLIVRLQQRVPDGLDGFSVRFEADPEALNALPEPVRRRMGQEPLYLSGLARFEDRGGRMEAIFALTHTAGNLALKTITLPLDDPGAAGAPDDEAEAEADGRDEQPAIEVVFVQLAPGRTPQSDLLFISDVAGRHTIALRRPGSMPTPRPQPAPQAPAAPDAAQDPLPDDDPPATTDGHPSPEASELADAAAPPDPPRPDMPEALYNTINHAIGLLETRQYEALFRHLAPAEVTEQLKAQDRLEAAAERFGKGAEGAALLVELRAARLAEPTLSEDGTTATFPSTADHPLTFQREGDRWVLR